MRHLSSNGHLEAIARDAAVKADYIADRTTTHARLGETLRRLYSPVADEPSDRLSDLLAQLDQRLRRA
jgi:Anti-sigma factor NepR